MYCISDLSCLRLSCCINAFIFCVHYLCLIRLVYVFYVGHVDKSSLYETLFHCNTLSKHHHHTETVLLLRYDIYTEYVGTFGSKLTRYIYIYIHISMNIYVYVYIYTHLYMYINIYKCLAVNLLGFTRKREYDTPAQSIYHRKATIKTKHSDDNEIAKPIVFIHGIGD
jgi:hypothetical protein